MAVAVTVAGGCGKKREVVEGRKVRVFSGRELGPVSSSFLGGCTGLWMDDEDFEYLII